ncbi:O-antigen polymerase [Aeromonas enteropelogenes]|uniref:O-antigen polymerase n=1 Tax=Aeromonas enteropelogenes TaxID=29489 RepID=UPI003BA16684
MRKSLIITLVFLTYAIMAFFSIVLGLTSSDYSLHDDSNTAGLVYYSICLMLLLSPFLFISYDKKIKIISLPSLKALKIVNLIFIFSSLISVVYFSVVVYKLLTSQNLETFRHLLVAEGHPIIENSLLNTFSGVVASFYTITMFLFYINLITRGRRYISAGLFIGSFSYPLFVFSYFGRDGFLFWVVSFLSLYVMFYNMIEDDLNNRIKKLFIGFSLIFFILFMLISFARFGDFNSVLEYINIYLGQQPFIFAEIFSINLTPNYGATSFPLFSSLFLTDLTINTYLRELGGNISLSWQFGTLLKDFYLDFGAIGLVIFIFLSGLILSLFFFEKKRNSNFFKLFLFFAYSQIIIQGVFYYRQYNEVGNLYIILLFILALLYRYIPCKIMYVRE